MVVHTCNPSTWEAETGGSQVQGQLHLLGETQQQKDPVSKQRFLKRARGAEYGRARL